MHCVTEKGNKSFSSGKAYKISNMASDSPDLNPIENLWRKFKKMVDEEASSIKDL